MTEPIAFEIPIYRCDIKTHTYELNNMKEVYYSQYAGPRNTSNFESYIEYIERTFCYAWKYNVIIGYLNLYFLGNQFRIEYWFVKNQRINKGIRKKNFIYLGKIIEKDISKLNTSEEIYSSILQELIELKKYPRFRKRHIDVKAITVIGEFVDWKKISEKVNRFKNPEFRKEYIEVYNKP